MLFCKGCGSLTRRERDGSRVCPACGRAATAPSAPAASGGTVFQRASDMLPPPRPRAGAASSSAVRGGGPRALATTAERPHPYFPFATARRGQLDFLHDVESTIARGGLLLAQVPTGIGKTAAVLAPAVRAAIEEGRRVFFLTPKQSQHTVVVDTLRMIRAATGQRVVVADLISKQAMCPRREAKQLGSAAFNDFCGGVIAKGTCHYWEEEADEPVAAIRSDILHVGEAVATCVQHGVCPTKALVEAGREAHVVVLDYNHFFSDMLEGTLERFKLELEDAVLVVDEAHNLPERIRGHLTWRLHPGLLVDASGEARRRGETALARFLDACSTAIEAFATTERVLTPEDLAAFAAAPARQAWPLQPPDLEAITGQIEGVAAAIEKADRASSACAEVASFLRRFNEGDRGVFRATDPDGQAVVYRQLDASVMSRAILREVRAAVLMSGTLYPMEMYAQILGADPARVTTRLYENPFPPENRSVVVDAGVSTAYKDRSPATFDAIASRIAGIAGATPGNVAAFFPSYEILDQAASRLGSVDRKLITEARGMEKDERERLVGALRRAGGHGLLLGVQGGSLSEGYDFVEGDNNLIRSIVVVGVPFERPSLETKALEAFYEASFGAWKGRLYGMVAPAARRMLQAAGRAIRAPHHTAFIALLDHRFSTGQLPRCYPPDFRHRSVRDVATECRLFFQRQGMRD